jgi:hypothetical protein
VHGVSYHHAEELVYNCTIYNSITIHKGIISLSMNAKARRGTNFEEAAICYPRAGTVLRATEQ